MIPQRTGCSDSTYEVLNKLFAEFGERPFHYADVVKVSTTRVNAQYHIREAMKHFVIARVAYGIYQIV